MQRLVFFFFIPFALFANTWTPPVDVSDAGQEAVTPAIDMNESGQAVLVWVGDAICRASTMTFGGAWDAPTPLQSTMGEIATAPTVKINDSGQAIAGWRGTFNWSNQKGVFTTALSFGTTWSPPEPLELNSSPLSISLSIASAGQTLAGVENLGSLQDIKVYKSLFGGNWSSSLSIGESGGSNRQSSINFSSNGTSGMIGIIWKKRPSPSANTLIFSGMLPYYESYPGGSSVTGTQLSESGSDADEPQLSFQTMSQAIAIWSRSNGTETIIQSSEKSGGLNWSTPINLSTSGQNATSPQIMRNTARQAIALWQRSNGTNIIIQAATKESNGTWSSPTDLSAIGQNASMPRIAMNACGQAVAIWKRSNGTNTIIQASTFNFLEGWSTPTDLSSIGEDADNPCIVINANGQIVAVWQRFNGANNVIQATTTLANPLPPSNCRINSKIFFGAQQNDRFMTLKWTASPSPNVVSYKLYRNGSLIKTLNTTTLSFQDYASATESASWLYEISALDSAGGESTKIAFPLP